jgi:5-methylcytosine-specific restriction endonuclease McrA
MPKDPRASRAWRAVSKAVLARDNYTCAYCYGEATTTDHIESVKYRPELALSLDNLVASCKPCNSRKGSKSQAIFLAKTFTPPVFSDYISPKTDITTQSGPCLGQPAQSAS